KQAALAEVRRLFKEGKWRRALLTVVSAWNRNQIRRILTAILLIWLVGSLGIFLVERRSNANFDTYGETLWDVWVMLFSGVNNGPEACPGRLIAVLVIVSGVALAGLFTASVASILIEQSLRSREVTSLEMSEHLVLCHWHTRALEWIREVHS